ncbi:MAG: pyruvate kinase [Arenicella sp.]
MQRRTKIIATLGPSSNDAETIEAMVIAGVNVFRLNFSHGQAEQHKAMAALVREASNKVGRHTAIMGDLQGPKIRIGAFSSDFVDLVVDSSFIIDSVFDLSSGDEERVGINFELGKDCEVGQTLLLDDGRIELLVTEIAVSQVITRVVVGGRLHSRKGLNLRGGGISNDALTSEDKDNIKLASELNLDYLAVSFPVAATDMDRARKLCASSNYFPGLIAKIERAEVVASDDTLNAIIRASEGVMVARGDLGVEIGDAELIGVQKKIITSALRFNKVAITATQMMETMIENTIPTRAEVFDVANAVLDGTDAVMLSAETATGLHPEKVVQAMSRIILGAEKHSISKPIVQNDVEYKTIDRSIAMAGMFSANHLTNVKAIVCFTESGDTPLWMSRVLSGIQIFALSRHEKTLNRVAIFKGVNSFRCELVGNTAAEVLDNALEQLVAEKILEVGDITIATYGNEIGKCGYTDTLTVKIIE